ncbi:hypothetical protein FQN53_009260 [Emmonsiellopsis sp. PD_33]|nr:hypothetical protein FQN53_009260 [Emmonsiellopsis sp. PD_33]KAK2797002.1 hypothetical protein FQN51_008863 [Onygenales sp. PD_10]
MELSLVHPSRKILLIVTTGGFTHASPVLEIGRVLAARGHTIEFATLEGQEHWVEGEEYGFITKVYLLGSGPTDEQLEAHYRRSQKWDVTKGLGSLMESKYLFDSFWPQTYHGLKGLMSNSDTRPDMMIADFFVEAVKDIHVEYRLPIAVVWPNMPFLMMPCSYIPGQPDFQLDGTLTSETASMWLRIRNELVVVTGLGAILKWMNWTKQMRRANNVYYPTHRIQKPDYLVLVNSFFGLEVPRDLPPTCALVGPLLSPTYPPLDDSCQAFLDKHRSDTVKIINGVMRLIQEHLIDGVIWAIGRKSRQDLDGNEAFQTKNDSTIRMSDLLSNKHPDWLFPFFAPQRAILDHESTKLYFTHGGGSSANEGLYHGKPLISMGFFFDQVANTTRVVAAGVAESLNKFDFTSDELYAKIRKILQSGENGNKDYQRNVLRMKRIAHIASKRKNHAADLVEELMYDNELRFSDIDRRHELQPMHLQTADMRMPAYKAKNWDLYAVSALGISVMVGSTLFAGQISSSLAAFAENPCCRQCGLSAVEGDSKMQDELASLFARQMNVAAVPNPASPQTAAFSTPDMSPPSTPSGRPITYSVTQHYHHSSHQAPSGAWSTLPSTLHDLEHAGVSAEDILSRYNIDPLALWPSQLHLFKQAGIEQKARLIELWQISRPTVGNSDPPQTHTQPSSDQSDEMMDSNDMDGMDHDGQDAEPYVMSGYEALAQREYDLSATNAAEHASTQPPPASTYKPAVDPVYKGHEWWDNSSSDQPLEHQYGAFESRNMYMGCGITRAHWLDDQNVL